MLVANIKMPIPHPFLTRLNLSPPQNRAATARQGDVVVTAGAGTGKTRTLVARYISLLSELPLRHIVAITFTDKAAREMRNRVRLELERLLVQVEMDEGERQPWQERLTALDSARISTIHSLCGELLRTHPALAGLDPRFTVLAEGDTLLLRAQAVEWALAEAARQETMTPLFTLWGETRLADLLLVLLNQADKTEKAWATLPAEPTALLALWRVHLEKTQKQQIDQLLARRDWQDNLAFLHREQASRADDKLDALRRMVLTALDELGSTLGQRRPALDILDEIRLNAGSAKNWPGGSEQIAAVKGALAVLRSAWREVAPLVRLELNEQDEQWADCLPLWQRLYAAANRHYQSIKTERQALDFDDLEALALHLLETEPEVRHYWQAQVGALLVDEFQDTNARQLRLVRHLCPEPNKLFIVGDAKQSIYRFRGADVAVFQQERTLIERAGGTVCDLDESYRTHQGLLAAMNHLLRPILGEPAPHRPAWEAPFAPLQPTRAQPGAGITAPFVELHLGVGTKGEGALAQSARMVAERLKQLATHTSLNYGGMVILCRASTSFAVYEDALDAAGVPYVTVAGQGFYQRPEIRDLLNALQAVADPSDNLALAGLLRSPLMGLSDVALYELAQARGGATWQSWWARLKQGVTFSRLEDQERAQRALSLIDRWHAQAGRQTVAELLQAMISQTGYLAGLLQVGQTRAARNIQKLLTQAQQTERIRIEEFLTYLAHMRQSGSREGEARTTAEGVVQIMSVHQAKGLEFPLVVLGDAGYEPRSQDSFLFADEVGLLLKLQDEEKQAPALFTLAEAHEKRLAAAEEKRLLYVAMTRAEQMVLVSGVMGLNRENKPQLKGWLKDMAQAMGLTDMAFPTVEADGANIHEIRLNVASSPIRLMLYEGQAQTEVSLTADVPAEIPLAPFVAPTLLEPLGVAAAIPANEEHPKEAAQPQRVWQVVPTAQKPTAPAWVVGSLVHAALALWRFPDAVFDIWCLARAKEYGLTDTAQLRDAVAKTKTLLERFRQHPLWAEIAHADRRFAELPYVVSQNGRTERGIIDVLYFHNGQWTVVDYKTDEIPDEAGVARLLAEKDYREQLERYAVAVEKLVGTRPRLLLCFLQVRQQIWLKCFVSSNAVQEIDSYDTIPQHINITDKW